MSYIIVGRKKLQSTPSVGRATLGQILQPAGHQISIHALRGEGDALAGIGAIICDKFLSTPSVGRATRWSAVQWQGRQFLSTPSVGRATSLGYNRCNTSVFLSTPSVGRATRPSLVVPSYCLISIHALRGEGDPHSARRSHSTTENFYPRPPWGGRRCGSSRYQDSSLFLSTPSVGRATWKNRTPR